MLDTLRTYRDKQQGNYILNYSGYCRQQEQSGGTGRR